MHEKEESYVDGEYNTSDTSDNRIEYIHVI
jgi:hypothetical protein